MDATSIKIKTAVFCFMITEIMIYIFKIAFKVMPAITVLK